MGQPLRLFLLFTEGNSCSEVVVQLAQPVHLQEMVLNGQEKVQDGQEMFRKWKVSGNVQEMVQCGRKMLGNGPEVVQNGQEMVHLQLHTVQLRQLGAAWQVLGHDLLLDHDVRIFFVHLQHVANKTPPTFGQTPPKLWTKSAKLR